MIDSWPLNEAGNKIAGDITHGAWSNPALKKVLHQFGQTAFARSSACMEFEAFLVRVGARGRCALEIGTFYGVSAIVLSQYFERVICVTIDVAGAKDMKYQMVNFLGIKNIDFYDVATNADKKRLVDSFDFDFAYSDGDHVNDTIDDWNMVRRCGRVMFHEYWPIQPAVWNLVNSLPQDEVQRAHYDCFAYWERKRTRG